jgi:hypothetical protein
VVRSRTWEGWTDANVETLMQMVKEGYSGQMIADALRCPSRNAVIGKIHRLGIQTGVPRRARVRKVRKEYSPRDGAKVYVPNGYHPIVKILERSARLEVPKVRSVFVRDPMVPHVGPTGCRWPVGESYLAEGERFFCGAAVPESPRSRTVACYCIAHSRVAVLVSSRRRSAGTFFNYTRSRYT